MINRNFTIVLALSLGVISGCSVLEGQFGSETTKLRSSSSVTMDGGEKAGESMLERTDDGILLSVTACCVTPGNAYAVWWLIGDVELSMTNRAIQWELGEGFVAEREQIDLELFLDAGPDGIANPYDGVRVALLEHGPDTGDLERLTTRGGGSGGLCPVVFRTSHAAP